MLFLPYMPFLYSTINALSANKTKSEIKQAVSRVVGNPKSLRTAKCENKGKTHDSMRSKAHKIEEIKLYMLISIIICK
jgi:hypothetical protein